MQKQSLRVLRLRFFGALAVIALCASFAQADSPQITYKVVEGIPYRSDANDLDGYAKSQCVVDLYVPTNRKNFPTVVWFHGGGLTGGRRQIPAELKNKGIAVVGVGYRLSPKVKVEQCVDDAAAAFAWTFNSIEQYGGSPKLIFVSGASAGGYLSALITLDKRRLAKYEIDANQIAGSIPFTGQAITHFTARAERGIPNHQPVIDELAPLYHVRGDACPILIISGDRELDLPSRFEENAYFHRLLKLVKHPDAELIEIKGTNHGTVVAAGFPEMLKFVNRLSQK
ncbi:alpha/beta hydrolase [Planctomicrobium sp. SH527]|uniref:alpha/beta hydrolase n=1 Tax=Planctomicrobium sp. SH527 TaxID=3448123 RepID=UPI003F5C5687